MEISAYGVLGIPIHAVQFAEAVKAIEAWISARGTSHFISLVNVHVLTEARRNSEFREILGSADLRLPDGTPVVWLGRLEGYYLPKRLEGHELILEFCRLTQGKPYRHYFYGGAPGVPEKIADMLRHRFPGLQIVGTYSPPFRALTPDEDAKVIKMISEANPDVLWVGLGAPKQERWIYTHRNRISVPSMIGVGQAFDILSGRKRQAPTWMRAHGFEWLFRFAQEPGRLWRRYLIYNPLFVLSVFVELLGLRRFE